MTFTLLVIGFAFGWAAITGTFTLSNLVLGGVLGAIALYLLGNRSSLPAALRRVRLVGGLALLFAYELALSAFKVAALVIRPDMMKQISPAIVAFPLTAKSDAEITLLANLITLTPGTLSIDVSDDKSVLYVHALDCRDRGQLVNSIARGFERKVIEVFQ